MLPKRSPAGQAALDVFYRDFNDVNFYVEDDGQENLFFEILKKLFGDVSFARIFPLSGKINLLNHAKSRSNSVVNNRIYIADKDFDDILGHIEIIDGVFYLPFFCIENHIVEETALYDVVVESHPRKGRESIIENLSLNIQISRIKDELCELFSAFYFVQLNKLELANCSLSVERFCSSRTKWMICNGLVMKYVDTVRDECASRALKEPENPLSDDKSLSQIFDSPPDQVISGKYVLKMVFHYVKAKYSLGSITFDSFMFRTAKNCQFESLSDFATKIREHLGRTGRST